MPRIIQALTVDEIEASRSLFREYEKWLDLDLCFQGFEAELADLPGKYAPPDGRLFLAYIDDIPAGCVALRKLQPGICEMKRLFVKDRFRGRGIGRLLIDELVGSAVAAGYERIRLDTYPLKMTKAVDMYRSYGFRDIARYYENPHAGVVFMELFLAQK
jgi:putative acetyltransferase